MESDGTSISSLHESSSDGHETVSTNTSQSPSPSVGPSHPKLPFKEFIPRRKMTAEISSSPTISTFSLTSDGRSSDITSSKSIASNTSDTSISTIHLAAATKSDDLLLSMKMAVLEFNQSYYLRRAEELGVSIGAPITNKLNPCSPEFTPRTAPVTIIGGQQRVSKQSRPRRRKHHQRIGEVWDGYVVQAFHARAVHVRKDRMRDWEWDEEREVVQEVIWSEDEGEAMEEKRKGGKDGDVTGKEVIGRGTEMVGKERKEGLGVDGGDECTQIEGVNGRGEIAQGQSGGGERDGDENPASSEDAIHVKGAKDIAPRGKSWMIVTPKLMQEYYDKLAA